MKNQRLGLLLWGFCTLVLHCGGEENAPTRLGGTAGTSTGTAGAAGSSGSKASAGGTSAGTAGASAGSSGSAGTAGTEASGAGNGGAGNGGAGTNGTGGGGTAGDGGSAGAAGDGGSAGQEAGIGKACLGCILEQCTAAFDACHNDEVCLICTTNDPTLPECLANPELQAAVACACQPSTCGSGACNGECLLFGVGQGGAAGVGGSASTGGSAGNGGSSGEGGSAGSSGTPCSDSNPCPTDPGGCTISVCKGELCETSFAPQGTPAA
ncbi:MAG: hypothetical protein RMJ98_15615, partial [Myxococcales bacterium]|nr:hypothetical protein [Myxococcales bacterium]